MYPVEGGPSFGSERARRGFFTASAEPVAIWLENDQIIAVNHFFIFVKPGKLLNVGCLKSLDTGEDL